MTTTVTVPVVARPIDPAMFADLTPVEVLGFAGDNASGMTVTFAADLDAATAAAVRCRLVTADAATEQLYLQAVNAIANNLTFLNLGSPTAAQVLAQVQALTRQLDAVIKVLLQPGS